MWFKIQDQQVSLCILVRPNAKKTALLDITEQGLSISLHAKPQEGEANKALIVFLAKLFKQPKSQIILQRGKTSRYKQVVLPLTDVVKQLLAEPDKFINNNKKLST